MRFIDIFAGIGGFRLPFEAAGHECVGYIEKDRFARRSYEAMFDTTGEWTATDIRTVKPSDLPAADIYTFGFPCQSFSIAGKRGGFRDTRGTLIFEVLRLAAVRKPLYLVGENVTGLRNHDKGKTFGTIISAMDELGYTVEWQLIDSQYYVPQHRERVYIVGSLRGGGRRKVLPVLGDSDEAARARSDTVNTITARYGAAQSTGSYVVESQ
jgi:DNA (cytosine-5)-methyltransferase 1